ncbi:MAG: hypothetical protein H3C47_06430 [Candidatus Cloacimonetes bacterium]|nr:hypothetical protein [Candidatus Cloacimonadota bacterium]
MGFLDKIVSASKNMLQKEYSFEVSETVLSKALSNYPVDGVDDVTLQSLENEISILASFNSSGLSGKLNIRLDTPEILWAPASHQIIFPVMEHKLMLDPGMKNFLVGIALDIIKAIFGKDLVGEKIKTRFEGSRIIIDLDQAIPASGVLNLIEVQSIEPKAGKVLFRFRPKQNLDFEDGKKVIEWATRSIK